MQRLFGILFFCFGFLSWGGLPTIARASSTTVHVVHNVQVLMANSGETAALSPEAVVPFHLHRGHIIAVKCSVGDRNDLPAIIDTGASETVLDIALARKLRLALEPDRATFVSQQAKVWAVTIPALELGPIRADHLRGIAADLSSLTAELGFRPQVVIGMDVLHRSSFLIDYAQRRLVFGAAPVLAHSAPLFSGESDRRFAIIEATIAGQTVRLQVDSGFEGLLLYGDRMQNDAITSRKSQIANVGQNLLTHTFSPPDVHIGDWRAPRAQVTIVEGPPPETAEFDGLIGTAFLSKTRLAFEFQNGRIFWE